MPLRKTSLNLPWLALLLFAAALTGCSPWAPKSAQAVDGLVDLSNGVDFAGGQTARLDGKWELYRDRLLTAEDFRRGGIPRPAL